jgi:hypothetical protein
VDLFGGISPCTDDLWISRRPDTSEGDWVPGPAKWAIDGLCNIKKSPGSYCVHANTNGPTLIVPLKEIVDMLTKKERDYLESIFFVSAFNSSIRHPQ